MSNHKDDQDGPSKDYSKRVPLERGVELSNFLNERAGGQENDTCPVCNDSRNVVLDTEYAIPISQTEPLIGLGGYAPAYATACVNCGYMRFFSKNMLDKLLADSKASDDAKVVD